MHREASFLCLSFFLNNNISGANKRTKIQMSYDVSKWLETAYDGLTWLTTAYDGTLPNGMVEKFGDTLGRGLRAALPQSGMPFAFWGAAVILMTDIYN